MGRISVIKKICVALLLLIILAVAFWVRSFTFWLPHWTGDQSQYVVLAMKLHHTKGLSGYNLQEVNVRASQLNNLKDFNFVIPTYAPGTEGNLMQSYHQFGLSYYDMPFWYKAPLLPMMLKWSHNFFLDDQKPFVVPQTNMGTAVWKFKPKAVLDAQFWLVIVPLMANLGTLVLAYWFSRCFMGINASLMAVFILAFNPVGILCSNRIWTEDLQAFFLWAGMLAYWNGLNHKKAVLSFAGGLLLGCSIMTNQKSMLFLPGIWLYGAITHPDFSLRHPKKWIRVAFHSQYLWLFAGCALVTHQWFLAVYHQFGDPLWQPDYSAVTSDAGTSWIRLLNDRPHSLVVYIVGGSYLCPPIFLGYTSVVLMISELLRRIKRQINRSPILYLWFAMALLLHRFLIEAHHSAEHRYLMTALPALAILSAAVMMRVHDLLPMTRFYKKTLLVLYWIFLIGSAIWSVPIAWKVIMEGRVLINIPF